MLNFGKPKWPTQFALDIEGKQVLVDMRQSPRARAYRLSIQRGGQAVLSVPPNGRLAEAEAFLEKQKHWLEARLKRAPKAVQFAHGVIFPLRGKQVQIESSAKIRGRVQQIADADVDQLIVPGGPDHLSRRLIDWLKDQAHADLSARSAVHAKTLCVTPTGVQMRSQSSRWGSCSSAGRLNYNWRLVLAPPFVLDYVAAHEVAHLREMNHSTAFWDRVRETLPEMDHGRTWLKANGSQLMVYGLTF